MQRLSKLCRIKDTGKSQNRLVPSGVIYNSKKSENIEFQNLDNTEKLYNLSGNSSHNSEKSDSTKPIWDVKTYKALEHFENFSLIGRAGKLELYIIVQRWKIETEQSLTFRRIR